VLDPEEQCAPCGDVEGEDAPVGVLRIPDQALDADGGDLDTVTGVTGAGALPPWRAMSSLFSQTRLPVITAEAYSVRRPIGWQEQRAPATY
jgi:hypothetical protein